MKKRVLIVDDERGFTESLRMSLERLGRYEAQTVNEGRDAANAARRFMPDVILLDDVMPGVGGSSVADELGADRKLQQIPVILMTDAPRPLRDLEDMPEGSQSLAKPIWMFELLQAIDAASGDDEPTGC